MRPLFAVVDAIAVGAVIAHWAPDYSVRATHGPRRRDAFQLMPLWLDGAGILHPRKSQL